MKIEQIYTGCLARVGNDKTIHVIGFAFWGSTFEWRAGQIIMSILRWRGKGVDSQKNLVGSAIARTSFGRLPVWA